MSRPERDRVRVLVDARRRELTQHWDRYDRLPGARVKPPLTGVHVPLRQAA